jgi:S-adenosyl-L-methionine hydrolase (adenosine-forming)
VFDGRRGVGYNEDMTGKVITLTTDFGLADGYVGVMKGVILGIAPEATIVDLSHEIRPQDVRHGAFVLKTACRYFPPGTIHVVVVDPGVGSRRRILIAQGAPATFVVPDNGVLSWAVEDLSVDSVVHATEARYWRPAVSRTFHGRDIFAPLAAHLARGVPVEALGPAISDWLRIPFPLPRRDADVNQVQAEILHIDRFGNLITNVEVEAESGQITNVSGAPVTLSEHATITIGQRSVAGLHRSYAEDEPGQLLAIADSSGYLELAVREGSAAAVLDARRGDGVQIQVNPI